MADVAKDNGGNCDADARNTEAHPRKSATHHFFELRHDALLRLSMAGMADLVNFELVC